MSKFHDRLKLMQESPEAQKEEVDAVIKVHDRLMVAQYISEDVFGSKHVDKPELAIAIFQSICQEASGK